MNPDLPASNSPQFHPVRDLLSEVLALQGRQQARETRRARELLQHPLVHDLVLTEKVQRQLTSARHNIFEALGVAHKENYHSRFIGYLFNPSGEHDQNDVFLRALLQWVALQIDLSSAVRVSIDAYLGGALHRAKAKVTTELDTGGYGRVDLVIELPGGTTVAIENKVYAGEQDRQLSRYWQWLRSRPGRSAEQTALIFLTPDGRAGATSAAGDSVVCMSYAHLAQVLERGGAGCPPSAISLLQSVSQYTHLCRSIATGNATMTKPNSDIQNLLDDPAQLEAAFTLAEQLEEKKKSILKNFSLHVVDLLNQELQGANLHQKPWIASLEPGNECIYGIGADGAFGKNYRCVVENQFKGWINVGWLNAHRRQICEDVVLQDEMVQQTGGWTDKDWWLCTKALFKNAPEASPLLNATAQNLLQLHEDNRDVDHPLAQRLAEEVWAIFNPFQERVQALLNPSVNSISSR
ncbi:PD-(D/E)XK nuclease family protein [Acidovorax sp. 69]|uniref:PDDEXK-like family protein n=1 Tax=Acidovorax sp. 69 TaxID=2035202 RepID=UPI0012FD866D|nr:PD-(D/E)XK nuclease family protein [Acidovorax sp. 69]